MSELIWTTSPCETGGKVHKAEVYTIVPKSGRYSLFICEHGALKRKSLAGCKLAAQADWEETEQRMERTKEHQADWELAATIPTEAEQAATEVLVETPDAEIGIDGWQQMEGEPSEVPTDCLDGYWGEETDPLRPETESEAESDEEADTPIILGETVRYAAFNGTYRLGTVVAVHPESNDCTLQVRFGLVNPMLQDVTRLPQCCTCCQKKAVHYGIDSRGQVNCSKCGAEILPAQKRCFVGHS